MLRELESPMIHYTCDRCKRTIDPETEPRYIVEIDVRMVNAVEPIDEENDEIDQLAELHDQLQREVNAELGIGLNDSHEPSPEMTVLGDCEEGPEQFDLCQHCHELFTNNPLGKEIAVGFGFSNN
jgi:hypothetical protein